ncbi:MAG TPA: hypothetical protein VJL29_00865 [Thermoguttaceae bacterium]|nr:hypothetical protein [Thermoguttaceae bacterium]
MNQKSSFHVVIVLLVLGGLLTVEGCGKSGVERHTFSGRVTFQGKPVPAGLIIFEPDVSKGNRGPQGYAEIIDGHYRTADKLGKGTMTGALVVTISSYPVEDASGENPSPPLFAPYKTNSQVSEETTTLDFDVPAKR